MAEIKLYKTLSSLKDEVQNIFQGPVFIQLTLSAVIICTTVILLKNVSAIDWIEDYN